MSDGTQAPHLLWEQVDGVVADPIHLAQKCDQTQFLSILESQNDGSGRGRYSFIGLAPDWVWTCDEKTAQLSVDGGTTFDVENEPVLSSFRRIHALSQCEVPDPLPGMACGLIGYMAYDAIRFMETTVPNSNPDPIDIPLGIFIRPSLTVVIDHQESVVYCCAPIWEDAQNEDVIQARRVQLEQFILQLKGDDHPSSKQGQKPSINFEPSLSKAAFCQIVEKAKQYIVDGDIFQVVPSQRWSSPFVGDPFDVYQELRVLNPSPFLFYLNFKEFQLVGSSPEIMVRVQDETVTIRPLAGTRKRGKTEAEDQALIADLLSDDKELAEHLMLVDLSRHDVGRVTVAGSVNVTEYKSIETYSHVMHITSNVEGKLDPDKDVLDALFSALPVGTVSGAPKVRAMQIIDELEPVARSFYAGCVGYFAADGNMDTCITLRTSLFKNQTMYIQAGAGIVADSNPELEYEETVNKAAALIKAAENVQNKY